MLKFLFLLILVYADCNAQAFYVNSIIEVPIENSVYELNIQNDNSSLSYVCPATNNAVQSPEQQFLDIAVNGNNEIFYISGAGSLYKRSVNDESTCQFLGSFNTATNALASDSNNLIYTVGLMNGISTLYKYDEFTGIFSTIGNFPEGFFSAGDLFFYQHYLFLTGTNADFTSSNLISVNLQNPTQSCVYMDLQNVLPFAAFAVGDETSSQAYILTGNNDNSALIELNMANATLGNVIRNYPFSILGAAAVYEVTSNNSQCTPMGIDEVSSYKNFKIKNPASGRISFESTLDMDQITNITIFDASGKTVKIFKQSGVNDLDIANIANGFYLVQISTSRGSITQKIIIKN
jgi:hypothetical protein